MSCRIYGYSLYVEIVYIGDNDDRQKGIIDSRQISLYIVIAAYTGERSTYYLKFK